MKRTSLVNLIIIIVSCFFMTCSDSDDRNEILSFSLQEKEITVSDLGETIEIPIISNIDWELIFSEQEFIHVEQLEETIKVTIDPNLETSERQITIELAKVGGAKFDMLKITQTKVEPRVEINGGIDFISTNCEEKTIEIVVKANVDWSARVNSQWISLDKKEGKAGETIISLSISDNPELPRNAVLSFDFGNKQEFIIQQNARNTGFESVTHYFYMTFGTLPTMYAGLHALSHDKPGYFAYQRESTFDPEHFPNNITLAIANGADPAQGIMRDYMKSKILEINKENPNAIFGLYVDDLRSRIGFDWFVDQGIDSSRVKVTMISDGTATYSQFYTLFGDAGQKSMDNWYGFANKVNALDWDKTAAKQSRSLPEFQSQGWAYYSATLPNYRYLLQDINLIETESSFIKGKIKEMKAVNITPLEMLKNLDEDHQSMFYRMARFDKKHFAGLFNESPKKNLVIIGTTNSRNQRALIQRVHDKYASEYDLFYKPHPADTDYNDYESRYPGMKLLPAIMPFEIFVWALDKEIDVIGGNSSTVFVTVPTDKVGFLFAAGPNELTRPLNVLFKDAATIEWIQ